MIKDELRKVIDGETGCLNDKCYMVKDGCKNAAQAVLDLLKSKGIDVEAIVSGASVVVDKETANLSDELYNALMKKNGEIIELERKLQREKNKAKNLQAMIAASQKGEE